MKKIVIIYDGECGLCQASVRWIKKNQLPNRFEYVTCQSDERKERFPQITTDACMTAIQVILNDGSVLSGADGIPEIITNLKRWRWIARILRLPFFRKLSPVIYAWIARNRQFLSCKLDLED